MPLGYWLETRKGFYDRRQLNRIRNQKAWQRYIQSCEDRFQQAQNDGVKELLKESISLDSELGDWLKQNLFQAILAHCKGDLKRTTEILKTETYQKLMDHYEIRQQLYAQYRTAAKNGVASD